MKTIFYFWFGLFILSVVIFCNINKDPLKSQNDGPQHIGFINNNCLNEEGALAKIDTRIYVRDYQFNQDTLTLHIHHTANCCPGFVVDIEVQDKIVNIAIADTLRNCLCFCEYINDFSFLYRQEGALRILFNWWDINHTQLVTEMDTTIIVTRQGS